MAERDLSMIEHLEEFRRRLLVCLAAVLVASAAVYSFSDGLLRWLARPVGSLVFIGPAEAFMARLKVSVYGGLFLAAPLVLYEAWGFVADGLLDGERRCLRWILPSSYVLFALGAGLGLAAVVPAAARFLMAYGSEDIRPLLSVNAYLSFAGAVTLAFGGVFQLPLILAFLEKAGLVRVSDLAAHRRHAYLGSFVLGALLTPGPDVFSQLLLALPTVVLFELSLAVLSWKNRRAAVPALDPT